MFFAMLEKSCIFALNNKAKNDVVDLCKRLNNSAFCEFINNWVLNKIVRIIGL